MSTRGCVAVRQPGGGWRGVYNHFDSYPTAFGADVYEEVKKKGLKVLAKEIMKWGDWREYLSGGVCEYCGKKAGQPNSIEGTIFGYSGKDYSGDRAAKLKAKNVKELADVFLHGFGVGTSREHAQEMAENEWPIIKNMQKAGYPDPKAMYHKHGDGAADQMTDKTVDALFIEWTYVLDPVEDVIEVWHHRRASDGKKRKKGSDTSEYELFKVTTIPMKDKKPDWTKVEKLGRKMAGYDDD